jgi:hypothetical protein
MRVHFTTHLLPRLALLAMASVVASPALAAGQSTAPPSLAELARQEAERRKVTKDAPKVITAKDLPESARKPATPPATGPAGSHATSQDKGQATSQDKGQDKGQATGDAGAPSQAAGDQKPAPPADAAAGQGPGRDEATWRGRITIAREALRRNEIFLQALQTRVNALDNDFRNGAGNFTQQAQVNADRQKTLEELERVKSDVEQSGKQVADIEEQARKAGVPPGWLR